MPGSPADRGDRSVKRALAAARRVAVAEGHDHGGGAGRLAEAGGGHGTAQQRHRVAHGEEALDRAPVAVDEERDLAVAGGVEGHELGRQPVGGVVVQRSPQECHPPLEEPVEGVVALHHRIRQSIWRPRAAA